MGELRVISGVWRGRRIQAGPVRTSGGPRPTSDRVRTSLFDRLAPRLPGARVLDLFAGSGALGIEALSRGAARVLFVEQSPRTVRLLEANLASLGAAAEVRCAEALRTLGHLATAGERFDIVLVDPPYGSGLARRVVAFLDERPLLGADGLLVVERDRREMIPAVAAGLAFGEERRYGDTVLGFYHGG